jgi:hypothetical protein
MSNLINLSSVANNDLTTTYYNNYYNPTFDVSQGVNDTVTSFFQKISSNAQTAQSLAGAVIYTAKSQNMDPMVVIQKFASMPAGQLNNYLVMFLNMNRVGSSYLGVANSVVSNKYINRTILA